MIELTDRSEPGARIKVIGVGGGGGNAINTMVAARLDGVPMVVGALDDGRLPPMQPEADWWRAVSGVAAG